MTAELTTSKQNLMPAKSISLAIVDNHALFRKTLKRYLLEQKDFLVSVEAADIADLLKQLKFVSIDVLIMELVESAECGSLEHITAIRSGHPDVKVLVLLHHQDLALISELLDRGIYGFISRTDEPQDLLEAIYSASENKLFRTKLLTEVLYWSKQNDNRVYNPKVILSERERKILQLIWEEKSNKMIADELFLGIRSIEKIRQDIKDKIGARSTVGLIKYAIDKKIIGIHTL
jgi:DNA-binding NarL/FixJ family response regulator